MNLDSKAQKVMVIGFGRRFAAAIIDGIFVVFFSFVIMLALAVIGRIFGWYQAESISWNKIVLGLILIFSIFYYVGMWSRSNGQTFGKLMLGIQVVSRDGGPLTLAKAFLRYVGYLVGGICASLGFIWVAIDKKRRGWHDLLAGTYVISIRDDLPKDGVVIFELSDPGKGWIWLVLWGLLALTTPAALFSGLWFLGPAINGFIDKLLSGLG
ncbi:MAG TPA: hypothetical protein DEH25_12325 [Chloroflexi bacterium]|nr:hypothetical protein [Chloroflexota bacterium]HBY06279.1 hypothetical protein [Chloroflexota bacterium]